MCDCELYVVWSPDIYLARFMNVKPHVLNRNIYCPRTSASRSPDRVGGPFSLNPRLGLRLVDTQRLYCTHFSGSRVMLGRSPIRSTMWLRCVRPRVL